ncbi:MAG: membrane protein insertion efficiency factor YidD [Acidimicrobiia bacterium]
MTRRPLTRVGMGAIRSYQRFVSPLLGRNCRFSPTCSAYALEALDRHGLLRGSGMALRRLGRCQPLVDGGYDPVPERI